jgi:hypothetical protein
MVANGDDLRELPLFQWKKKLGRAAVRQARASSLRAEQGEIGLARFTRPKVENRAHSAFNRVFHNF